MLKKLFTIPDTFDPDDQRRRQVLNVLLTGILITGITALLFLVSFTGDGITALTRTIKDGSNYNPYNDPVVRPVLASATIGIGSALALLIANRSTKIPGWLTGSLFVIFLSFALLASGTPDQNFSRDLMYWVLPVSIGAIVIRPEAGFLIAAFISTDMWFTLPHPGYETPNFYPMISLFLVAFVSWLGMSIANRAIRDARRHAANNEAILKSIADGVLVLDQQGKFVSANPALLKMIPEDELDEIITRPLDKTIRWKRKVFSISVSEVPEIGTVAVFRDDTRRFEIERARDALLATASHELRTPLTAVTNYLEMLQVLTTMGKINSDDFNEHIARALENVKRLQNLVNNILDQAQIQAGALTLKHEPFNVRSLIEKAHQLLAILLEQKNLSYELEIAPNVPAEISGDANRLHQVLVNLLGNAIKFTNQGGIKVNVSMPLKEKLSIEVVDSGPGIPAEQLPDIFEAFRRGSNYAQRERQGAGLGLSIAKEIVTRMGGEISVSSQPGNGSVFTIMLPINAI
jgi:signal transduction histidine kinase